MEARSSLEGELYLARGLDGVGEIHGGGGARRELELTAGEAVLAVERPAGGARDLHVLDLADRHALDDLDALALARQVGQEDLHLAIDDLRAGEGGGVARLVDAAA